MFNDTIQPYRVHIVEVVEETEAEAEAEKIERIEAEAEAERN